MAFRQRTSYSNTEGASSSLEVPTATANDTRNRVEGGETWWSSTSPDGTKKVYPFGDRDVYGKRGYLTLYSNGDLKLEGDGVDIRKLHGLGKSYYSSGGAPKTGLYRLITTGPTVVSNESEELHFVYSNDTEASSSKNSKKLIIRGISSPTTFPHNGTCTREIYFRQSE
jgi:hypothetical protein